MTQTSVLLVDQQSLFRQGLALIIGQQPDWTVVGETGSVGEAVEHARAKKPSVVLTELNLPDGTGFDVARCILSCLPETTVVILTTGQDERCAWEAIRQGIRGYLPKDLSMRELFSYLKRATHGDTVLTPPLFQRVLGEAMRRGDCGQEASLTPEFQATKARGVGSLTRREKEIADALARGASNREIAEELVISENTVKHHVASVLYKMRLRSRRQLLGMSAGSHPA